MYTNMSYCFAKLQEMALMLDIDLGLDEQLAQNDRKPDYFVTLVAYIIDVLEHTIYSRLDYGTLSNKKLTQQYCNNLVELEKLHATLTNDMLTNELLCTYERIVIYKNQSIEFNYVKEQLFYLMNRFYPIKKYLTTEFSEKKHVNSFYSFLYKIATRPLGMKLILNLATLLKKNKSYKISLCFNQGYWKVLSTKNDNISVLVNNISPPPERSEHEFGYENYYKWGGHSFDYADEIILNLPEDRFTSVKNYYTLQVANLSQAKYGLSMNISDLAIPGFLKLAHELIHILHLLRRKFRAELSFQSTDSFWKQHMKNPEEYWTIYAGKLSEVNLAAEHGFPVYRFSHNGGFAVD